MNNSQLQAILGSNVVELTFVRRHPKLGWSNVRGLFGTTNFPLLNGEFGSQVLNFMPPKGVGMGYDYKQYGLCVVWDMFRQEYRVFGAEQVSIRKQFPLTTPEDQQAFMDYFYEFIIGMSNQDKLDFMGYIGNSIIPQQMAQQQAQKEPEQSPNKPTISSKLAGAYQNVKNKIMKFFKR